MIVEGSVLPCKAVGWDDGMMRGREDGMMRGLGGEDRADRRQQYGSRGYSGSRDVDIVNRQCGIRRGGSNYRWGATQIESDQGTVISVRHPSERVPAQGDIPDSKEVRGHRALY